MKSATATPTLVPPLGPAFTVRECAAYLGFNMSRMRRLIAGRKIRVLRAGHLVIYQAWADDFVRRNSTPADGEVREAVQAALTPQPRPRDISDLPGANRFPSARTQQPEARHA